MPKLNLNSFPYYDDFTGEKKFHRIMFKPGYAVQARELTQLQSILQEQIKRFGDNIFKQGSVITGCAESHNFAFPFIKILDNSLTIAVPTLTTLVGQTLTKSNGVTALIKQTKDGSEAETPNFKTLYLQYTSNDTTTGSAEVFAANDVLTLSGGGTVTVASTDSVGEGSMFSLSDGILYVDGSFIIHNHQTIVIDRYTTTPTQKVGFVVSEVMVTSDDDSTLLDPAQGSYNYTAPGADRYKLSTVLTSYGANEAKPDGFYLLFEVEAGSIKRRFDKTQYAELSKEFAHRTYDESGDYTVRPFPIVVSEHLDNGTNHGKHTAGNGGLAGKLSIGVAPGKAYVKGYENELFSTENIAVDKATDTATLQNQYIGTTYGNYILINEVAGIWNVTSGITVTLWNTATAAVTGGDYGADTASGTIIGSAKVRNIVWYSGTPGTNTAQYKLYLYDIVMTSSSFDLIRGVSYTDGVNKSFGDPVVVSSVVTLYESKYGSTIFPLTHANARSLSDISYVYRRQYSGVSVSSAGIFNLTAGTGEEWAFSETSAETLHASVMVITENAFVDGATPRYKIGQVVDFPSGGNDIEHTSSTALKGKFNLTFTGTPTVTVYVNVKKTIGVANPAILNQHRYVRIDTTTHPTTDQGPYSLGFPGAFSIEQIWSAPIATAWPTVDPAGDVNWTDVTTTFDLHDGQTDNYHGLGYISKGVTSGVLTNKKILVKVTYISSSSAGFRSIDSYVGGTTPIVPAENVAPSASQIYWHQIPKYTTSAGITYNLRDVVDFRPVATITATDATTIAAATTNPLTTLAFSGSLIIPQPNGTFIADLTYHLSRVDRIVLDSSGTFSAIRGTPADVPTRPKQPDNAMTLGYVNIPPYPSLSPYFAKQASRLEYATSVTQVDNRRFTMRDIGQLSSRIDKLEYYTSLSLLEQSTANLLIPNATTGLNRYKNGILVDSFIGHNTGNVYDSAYACSVTKGELRPFFNISNTEFEFDNTSTTVVRKANDAIIVVERLLAAVDYKIGDAIVGSGSGSGTLRQSVLMTSDANYKWVRLYLENVTGTFASSNTINGVGTDIITYGTMSTALIPAALRPDLVVASTNGTLVTLPYTHKVYTENPYASKSRNCASQILFSFDGMMTLSPNVDTWIDTSIRPEVQMNTNGVFDNWLNLSNAWGTEWENWRSLWQGKTADSLVPVSSSSSTPTSVQRESRDGISLTNQVTDSNNIVPYIRSSVVTFSATHLKANTRVYPFFDGIDVSAYCKMDVSTAYPANLITSATGTITGQFRIPAEMFTVGTKNFVLVDNATNPNSSDKTTIASATYTASGSATYENRTIISTQASDVTHDRQRQTQNVVVDRQVTTGMLTDSVDPFAQTFFVSNSDGGILLTKIDVYFKEKSTTSAITLQLREVVNNYPADTILPYSTVTLDPKDVNTSNDATSVTQFKFPAPVYLKNDTEYCFVLIPVGNDENYEVWVSELGSAKIGTTEIIDKQPNAGALFVAGNSRTWTQFINEDAKFTAYGAIFDISSPGNLILHNLPVDYLTLTSITGFNVGDSITSATGAGKIKYLNTTTKVAEVLITSGTFVASDTITIVGTTTSTTTTRGKKLVNALSPTLSFLDFNNTSADWSYELYDYSGTVYSGYTSLPINGTTDLDTEKGVFSYSEYNNSFMMKSVIASSATNISPIIDLTKTSCLTIANSVSSVSTNEDTNTGSALSKYISRTVVLDDGQEAQDLRVYLSMNLPSTASVLVYGKFLNSADSVVFTNRPWTLMGQTAVAGTDKYKQYYYSLPTNSGTTTSGGLVSGIYKYTTSTVLYTGFKTFAVKIVLLSNDTINVPHIRDFRAIAMQA